MNTTVQPPKDDVSKLVTLGSKTTEYLSKVAPEVLETFPNLYTETDYVITFKTEEWTARCPKTGQPDFGIIRVSYVPNKQCVESKSLKLYLFSYRDEQTFMETVTNRICNDLIKCCSPKKIEVEGMFNARGGITTNVIVSKDFTRGALTAGTIVSNNFCTKVQTNE